MDDKLNNKFKFGDFIALCLVVILAFGVFMGYFMINKPVENAKVQIYHNNELIKEFPLDSIDEITYTIEGEYVTKVVIKDGEVFFIEANCPGTDCVHSGSISKPGRSLVCLPNRVEIRITGTSDTDFVVG